MKKHEAKAPNLAERIVIAGGAFAGVTLAHRLKRLLPEQTEIVVLGADNHLVFTPLPRRSLTKAGTTRTGSRTPFRFAILRSRSHKEAGAACTRVPVALYRDNTP